MISSDEKIRRIYIKEGFDEEPVGYDIGMLAQNVDYVLENGDYSNLQIILSEHFGSYVFTEEGAHGIRYYNDNLSVIKIGPDGKPIINPSTGKYEWYDIPIGGGTDLEIDGVLNENVDSIKHTAYVYWTDPQDIMLDNQHILVEWGGTRILRTIGSYATGPDDPNAQIICDIERNNAQPEQGRNQHSTFEDAIEDTGADLPGGELEYNQTYYYTFYTFKKLSNGDRKYSTGEKIKKVPITPHEVIIDHVPYQKSEKENLPMYDGTTKIPHFEYNKDELAFTIDGDTSGINGRLETNPYLANFTPTTDYVWSDEICESYQVAPQGTIKVPWRIRPQEINIPEISGPIDPEDSKICYTYTRNEFGAIEQGPTITYQELTPEDDNDNYDMIIFTDEKGENANNYTLKMHLDNPNENDTNYIWKNQEQKRADILVNWKIVTRFLPKPSVIGDGNYHYTGDTISVELDNYNFIYMEGRNLANIDAGDYRATFDLKNEQSVEGNKNCRWDDGTSNQIILPWYILPFEVIIPFISEAGKQLVYNGQEQNITPYIQEYNTEYMTLTNPEKLVGTDADSYGLIFKLNNDTKRNYAWKDVPGSRMYANQIIYWTIHQAENDEWSLDYPYKNGLLPYDFANSNAILYHNKIHILGGDSNSSVYRNHYSYDGTEWIEEITLPYDFYQGCAVVYNNRIHILGGNSSTATRTGHYSWGEGETEWKVETSLPYNFYDGCAIVYEDKIHILGGGSTSSSSNTTMNHYTWPETDENNNIIWKKQKNLSKSTLSGGAAIFDNTIYLIHGRDTTSVSYLSNEIDTDGERIWKEAPSLPNNYSSKMVIAYDDTIYCFYHDGQIAYLDINSSEWILNSPTATSDIPITSMTRPFFNNSYTYQTASYYAGVVIYNNKIHILGGRTSRTTATSATKYHYECQNINKDIISIGRLSDWRLETLAPPYPTINGASVIYRDKIHLFGGSNKENVGTTKHYSFDGIKWQREKDIPYDFCQGKAIIWNDRIYLIGNYAGSATSATFEAYTYDSLEEPVSVTISDIRKACISIGVDENSDFELYWRKETDLPQFFNDRGVVIYNNKIHLISNSGSYSSTASSSAVKIIYYFDNDTKTWIDSGMVLPNADYRYTDALIINNQLYILAYWYTTNSNYKASLYIYDETQNNFLAIYSFNNGNTLKDNTQSFIGSKLLFYDNKIHLLGGRGTNFVTRHYIGYDNVCDVQESVLPESISSCRHNELIYKNKILFIGRENTYIYNNSAPSWSPYGIINIDTVAQLVFLNEQINIQNNKSTSNQVQFIIDGDQEEITDYCTPKITNQTILSFDLLRVLYRTLTEDKGQKKFRIKLNIMGDTNYKDSTKYVYINLIGAALAGWSTATDKEVEILIKAKDYLDNQGHKLQIFHINEQGEKIYSDFQLDSSIGWGIGEERIIYNEKFSYIDNITKDTSGQDVTSTKTVARSVGTTTTPPTNTYRYIILDHREDNIVGKDDKVPVIAIGLKTIINDAGSTTWSAANCNKRLNATAYQYRTWKTSLAKTFCDNMKKSFYLNYLIKERPNIGTLFLLSRNECRYVIGIDPETEEKIYNDNAFEYYKNEDLELTLRIKRGAYSGSSGTAFGWWTRDQYSESPEDYFYIGADGSASNIALASPANATNGYAFSPAMYI